VISIVSGILLMVMGFLVFTGTLARLTEYLVPAVDPLLGE
jgi:hypothetical protein